MLYLPGPGLQAYSVIFNYLFIYLFIYSEECSTALPNIIYLFIPELMLCGVAWGGGGREKEEGAAAAGAAAGGHLDGHRCPGDDDERTTTGAFSRYGK